MSLIPESIRPAGGSPKLRSLLALAQAAGPYVAIALLVPGGSIIALLAWLFRRGL